MSKKSLFKGVFIALMLSWMPISAQQMQMPQLPVDPEVRTGVLDNGLTYYIRYNSKPEKRAEFHIAQKVGSILEEENQRGLAHFLEHMAFNGTKNFPDKGILDYLEKNGVKFGQNINAYTAIEKTVYNLSDVPTTNPGLVDSCLLVLHDWSGFITLAGEEIDNERGVILEEWRTRSNPVLRMLENTVLPDLYPNNRYGHRMPIGTVDVITGFDHQAIRDYYHKWYRPDLQGIVIVGDIDVDKIEARIKELWSDIPAPVNPAERYYLPVEDNDEPLVSVATDKESPINSISVSFKQETLPRELKNTQIGYVNLVVNRLITMMINERFEEMAQKPDAPFISASSDFGGFLVSTTRDALSFDVSFKEGGWKPAFNALIASINTIKEYGFTPSEFERAKANYMSMMENALNEKGTEKNITLTREYINLFTDNEPAPGIEVEYQICEMMLSQIPLDQINVVVNQYISDKNVAMYMLAVEKEGVNNPTNEELLATFKADRAMAAVPFEEKVSNIPLIAKEPKAGKVKKVSKGDFGTTVWTLSNGAKVIIKPTDFKKDEISMNVFSKGGKSMLAGAPSVDRKVIGSVIDLGGLGAHSATDLPKVLAGKRVSVAPYIGDVSEGLDGTTTPKDIETLLQLTYLYFTDNRVDNDAFLSWYKRTESALKSQEGTPNKIFSDSLISTLYGNNPEAKSLNLEELSQIDYNNIMNLYKGRFANAKDFTFVFVGNVDESALKPLVEKYIASLPSKGKMEKYNTDLMPKQVNGQVENRFKTEMTTPKVTVYNTYTVPAEYSIENKMAANAFYQVMSIVYTRTIREEEGGTYGVQTYAYNQQLPSEEILFIYKFDTNEEKAPVLEKRAFAELEKVANNGPEQEDFDKVKEFILKSYDQRIKENSYWNNTIKSKEFFNEDEYTDYLEAINNLTPAMIQDLAKSIVNAGNRIQVVSTGIQK